MPSTIYSYTLTGQSIFPVNFEYLARRFVTVTLVGQTKKVLVLNVDYRFTSKMAIITAVPQVPGEFQTIEIRRETSSTDRLVNFTDGSILRSQDLNVSQIQAIHIAEEARDISNRSLVNDTFAWNALGLPIINVADPSRPNDVTNKTYVDQLVSKTTEAGFSRTVRAPEGEPLHVLPPASMRANRVLGFDALGNPSAVLPSPGSGAELALMLANEALGSRLVASSVVAVKSLLDVSKVTPNRNQHVSLSLGDRSGLFLPTLDDVSTEVAADPMQGVYVPYASDLSGRGGAYVRQYGQAMGCTGINVDWFGAPRNNVDEDSAPAIYAASILARTLTSSNKYGTGHEVRNRKMVTFTPGSTYAVYTTVSLDTQGARLDWGCESGKVNIIGAHPSSKDKRNALGFSFNLLYRTCFKGINFSGFVKIHEWDTKNLDSATVLYDDCEFHDSGIAGQPVIDTRSFALSRSTDLVFRNCRATGVYRLLNSYCDTLRFEGCIFRNFDASGSFVLADSSVKTSGGMWVPYAPGDDARWFDLYDNLRAGSRGLYTSGTRFSPESGGIPIVKNFMDGSDGLTNRFTNSIVIDAGSAAAAPGLALHTGLIILAGDGKGNSIAPSIITINGSVRSRTGLIRTESGDPVNKRRGQFAIQISEASQSHLSTQGVSPGAPLVEQQLMKFVVGTILYKAPSTVIGSTTLEIDIGIHGRNPTINVSGSGSIVTSLTGAFDGERVTIVFQNNNGKVVDASAGSNIYLAGSAYTTAAWGTITLEHQRAGNKWVEISRSVR